jgi:predicted Zn-dependent protease
VLGLERCYAMIGGSEAILPLVDSLLARRPRDPMLRTVQLRTLIGVRREREAEGAFDQWIAVSPRDAAPFREYARLLLDAGRAAAADTVLRGAVQVLGGTRDLAAEFAQMQAALGLWLPSARSWREASQTMPYMEQAAVFSMLPTPDSLRDSVRAVFAAVPVTLAPRRILASLETRWRSAREGWVVLSALAPTDSVVQAWIDFAAEAEGNEAWLTARDAYVAAAARRPAESALAVRAATAALNGGEPSSALAILEPRLASVDSSEAGTGAVAVLQVRALAALGRATAIEQVIATRSAQLGPEGRAPGATRAGVGVDPEWAAAQGARRPGGGRGAGRRRTNGWRRGWRCTKGTSRRRVADCGAPTRRRGTW